jgi:filamentous hemagglutinin family protein
MACHPRPPALWCRCLCALLLSSALLLGVLRGSSEAQITLDGSLGPRGPLQGPNYRIGAELGQLRGSNLFHSFGEFNVPTGGNATFSGPPAIANILSRVTGGQPSAIDGALRSEIAGANLYLLNPSGVLFGPNVSLDVRGSFHVSTADFLRLADGAKFFADLGQASGLTVAPPVAFGFLGSTPAPITIQRSGLRVPTGRALSVVGGDIEMVGNGSLTANTRPTLGAPSGRIQLASVASPGDVIFSPLELAPDLRVDGFARLGQIALSQGAIVTVSSPAQVPMSSRPGAGTVLIRGGQLMIDNAFVEARTTGAGEGARLGIDVRLASVTISGLGSSLVAATRGAGRAGDITLDVGQLTLTGGAQINSSSVGTGTGGTITVTARDSVTISGLGPQGGGGGIGSVAGGSGAAGRIILSAPTVTIENGAISTTTLSAGRAGDITLEVGQLTLKDLAIIDSSSFGAGPGGMITVTARDSVTISGLGPRGGGGGIGSVAGGSGAAGRIILSAPRLTVEKGGISTETLGAGRAGDITVEVGQLTLRGSTQHYTFLSTALTVR